MFTKTDEELMALTPGEAKQLQRVALLIQEALASDNPNNVAHLLQSVEDAVKQITRRQFWSLR